MLLNDLAKQIHDNSTAKGFHDTPAEFGTLLMLIVSELGECLEADRMNRHANIGDFWSAAAGHESLFTAAFQSHMKDTVEDELADALIRILDVCALKEIDIAYHVEMKMRYNASRERLHGKGY